MDKFTIKSIEASLSKIGVTKIKESKSEAQRTMCVHIEFKYAQELHYARIDSYENMETSRYIKRIEEAVKNEKSLLRQRVYPKKNTSLNLCDINGAMFKLLIESQVEYLTYILGLNYNEELYFNTYTDEYLQLLSNNCKTPVELLEYVKCDYIKRLEK